MPWLPIRHDVELFYTDDGSGSPPVVLVHGWACDSHDWNWQIGPLSERYRVLAPDLRGHGRSRGVGDGFSAFDLAADLSRFLGEVTAEPAVVVGHSLGGAVAAVLAVEHPELVRAMVAVDPAYAIDPQGMEHRRALVRSFRAEGGLEAAADAAAGGLPLDHGHLPTWHRRRILGMPQRVVAEAFAGMYEAGAPVVLDPSSSAYVARRACPVLAFYVDEDRARREPPTAHHAGCTVVTWEGAGHWLHQERPAAFNEVLLGWLADTVSEPAG